MQWVDSKISDKTKMGLPHPHTQMKRLVQAKQKKTQNWALDHTVLLTQSSCSYTRTADRWGDAMGRISRVLTFHINFLPLLPTGVSLLQCFLLCCFVICYLVPICAIWDNAIIWSPSISLGRVNCSPPPPLLGTVHSPTEYPHAHMQAARFVSRWPVCLLRGHSWLLRSCPVDS